MRFAGATPMPLQGCRADLIEAGLNEPAGGMVLWRLWFWRGPWVEGARADMQIDGAGWVAAGVGLGLWGSAQRSDLAADCLVERSEPPWSRRQPADHMAGLRGNRFAIMYQ